VLKDYKWDEHIARGATHARSVTDDMAAQFVLAGTPDDLRRTVESLETCGVTHVLALMMGPRMAATVEALGRDIIPAWRPQRAAPRSLA
jgi:alkanesulfonate monooxygenase SsuD/methylene tetrahydromethanopterin reductase-like flavin-dependent oxidoreductase (luciferase family)